MISLTLAAAAALLLARALYRDWAQGAIAVSATAVLITSYGHFYEAFGGVPALVASLGRHRYLMPLWLSLLAPNWWRVSHIRNPGSATLGLNLIGAFLVAVPLIQLADHRVQVLNTQIAQASDQADLVELTINRRNPYPIFTTSSWTPIRRTIPCWIFINSTMSPSWRPLKHAGFMSPATAAATTSGRPCL